jgi:hypothetical protein
VSHGRDVKTCLARASSLSPPRPMLMQPSFSVPLDLPEFSIVTSPPDPIQPTDATMTDHDVSPNEFDEQGRKIGMWTEADSHGGAMTGEYVAGKRHGVWRHYFVDGSVRSEGTYDNGVGDGA